MKFSLSNFFIYSSILFVCCSSCNENRAVTIIKKSIATHGGADTWNSLESFSLEKETWLFFEDGTLETHSIQNIEFRKQPFFEAYMSWVKDSITHKIIFDGARTRYWMGENEIQNEGFLANKKKDVDAAYYVLTKPFDLLQQGKNLKYLGITKLADGSEVETIQVIDGDPKDPSVDIWWYFFDRESFRIIGYRVKTNDHFSMVYNQDWDNSTGILFPQKRESYRVDSLGNHLYLRAKYDFREYSKE
ncbi:hypothetical protein MMU07_17680 [Aquiflexum sp. LQ15W]|uniref:hypothetical protein n=1 Tax=Cognataquiflexum nitidum TaxID=2922272 RepID=UPI001F14726A|nr:hypothetical protein [Cognataquiflexum nitidum]MCH6201417.1 hypothetical protein [Cognataquiflexum nitidum]